MESGRGSGGGGGLGPNGKKMRKRKELDALVGGGGSKRGGGKRRAVDQLLTESSEEEDYWSGGGKVAGRGKCRPYPGSAAGGSPPVPPAACRSLLTLCTGLLLVACALTTLTVIWLFIDIRQQTAFLRNQLDQVAAGSQGVPDALQKCHSLSRQLQTNQSLLFSQLAKLSSRLENITSQIGVIQGGLSNVEKKLTASPELINVPQDLLTLTASVASFGGHIQDLQTSFNHLKEEQSTIKEILGVIKTNISTVNTTLDDLVKAATNFSLYPHTEPVNITQVKQELRDSFTADMDRLNESLSNNLKFICDDHRSDHESLKKLHDMNDNMTSRVGTIVSKLTDLENLSNSVGNISLQVKESRSSWHQFNTRLDGMNDRVTKSEENVKLLNKEVKNLKNYLTVTPSQGSNVVQTGAPSPTNLIKEISQRPTESAVRKSSEAH